MSMCDDFMICNYNKCRTKLSGYAWVTACSHIFCDQHGSGEFSQSPAVCPACNNTLTGKLDIVRVELNPSDEYKAVVLAGLRPEIILDISSRAITFWTYQIHQERLYQEYVQSKAEGKLKQMEKFYTQHMQSKDGELASVKGELSSIKKVLEEYKRKYSEVSEKLMERNRQYQKLQGLYDNMRLRNMVVNNQEAENCLSSHLFTFNPGHMNCHTPKSTPVRGTAVDPEIRQMFFRSPAKDNDKTDGRKAAFFQFGSPNNNQELCGCKGNTFYSKKY